MVASVTRVQDGECVGISFQSLKSEDAENVGYVVPVPVIEHFIKDYGGATLRVLRV